jgi:predicted lipid-binding transport protein (Tim44 family)
MDNIPYADIVILALIAGFILLRLRSVLGQKNGNEEQFFKRDMEKESAREREPVILPGTRNAPVSAGETDSYLYSLKNDAVAKTIADIKLVDPSFTATGFLHGAKMAFEMVFDAFAKGDRKTLEMLLDRPIYETFSREIEAREKADEKTEITLVSVKAKDITSATLTASRARLAVKFDSEQVSIVRDRDGKIIDGDPSNHHPMDDEWVFERDISSKNPNWKIIET